MALNSGAMSHMKPCRWQYITTNNWYLTSIHLLCLTEALDMNYNWSISCRLRPISFIKETTWVESFHHPKLNYYLSLWITSQEHNIQPIPNHRKTVIQSRSISINKQAGNPIPLPYTSTLFLCCTASPCQIWSVTLKRCYNHKSICYISLSYSGYKKLFIHPH